MKAILLAAGKSTRTYPLTLTRPKPLLKVANRTLLHYQLDALRGIAPQGLVDEVVMVVGYKKEMIESAMGSEYNGLPIRYIEQKEQLGTGHAALHPVQCPRR